MKNLLNNHYIKTLAIILLVFAIFIAMFLPVAGTTYASAETSSNLQIGNMDKSIDFLHGNSLNQSSCDSEPNMTILTHGLGGDGLAWSKGYKTNNDPVYIYSPHNLIEQLKYNAKNAEILLCKNFDSGANINFNVYKMTPNGIGNPYLLTQKTELTYDDINKHLIIIFESSDAMRNSSDEYSDFHYMVDSFFYNLKTLGIANPKLNLIGHSRGGIINTMYAIAHSHNVSSIFNIATPMNGSESLTLVQTIKSALELYPQSGFAESINNILNINAPGYQDINDITLLENLKNSWNEIQSSSTIEAYSISAVFGVDYLRSLSDCLSNAINFITDLQNFVSVEEFFNLIIDNYNLINMVKPEYENILNIVPLIKEIRDAKNIMGIISSIVNNFNALSYVLPAENVGSIKSLLERYKMLLALGAFLPENALINSLIGTPLEGYTKDDIYMNTDVPLRLRIDVPTLFSKVSVEEYTLKEMINQYTADLGLSCENLFGEDEPDLSILKSKFNLQSLFQSDSVDAETLNQIIAKIPLFLNVVNGVIDFVDEYPILTTAFVDGAQIATQLIIGIAKLAYNIAQDMSIPVTEEALAQYILDNIDHVDELVENILDKIRLKSYTDFKEDKWEKFKIKEQQILLMTDILVEYTSQNGNGFNGFEKYGKIIKDNINFGNLTNPSLPIPIPHNLETKDIDIKNYILEKINLGSSENSIFKVVEVGNQMIEIIGVDHTYNEDTLIIPATLYGKTVIGIGNKAFQSSQFSSIVIPSSVSYISDYAFANNTSLTGIVLPDNCHKIGESAFSGCANLTSVQISKNLIEVGDDAFLGCNKIIFTAPQNSYLKIVRNCLIDASGNTLIKCGKQTASEFNVPDGVTNIYFNAFCGIKDIQTINLNDVEILNEQCFIDSGITTIIGGEKLTEIGRNAFADTPWINNQSTNTHVLFGDCYIKYNGYELDVNLSGLAFTSIAGGAFENTGVQNLVLPNTLHKIGNYAFYNCTSLQYLLISDNISEIGNYAFSGCTSLTLDFRKYNVPVLGGQLTSNSGSGLEIYVPYLNIEEYRENRAFGVYAKNIKSISTAISFITGTTQNFSSINQPYYSLIDELPIPEKIGYQFIGWYLNEQLIQSGSLWLEDANSTLTARWEATRYQIEYSYNEADVENNPVIYTIEDEVVFHNPEKVGNTFGGWFDNPEFNGTAITKIEKGSLGNLHLYAKWELNSYHVQLDKNGSEALLAETQKTIQFTDSFVLPIPERKGFDFIGWYLGRENASRKLTNSVGTGLAKWDITENTTLYAHWEAYEYSVKIINQSGDYKWLDSNGISNQQTTIPYSSPVSIYDAITTYFQSQYRTGWIYTHYITNFDDDYSYASSVPYLGADGTELRIYPQWKREKYVLYCYDGGNIQQTISAEYNAPVNIVPLSKDGYEFVGWQITYASSDVNGTDFALGKMFNASVVGMPDLSPKESTDATLSISSVWREKITNIILDEYGNYQIITMHEGDVLNSLTTPVRIGYQFIGWYDENDNRYYNDSVWSGPYGNLCLIAKWNLSNYEITYDLQGAITNNNPLTYNIESSFILVNPEKIGYHFNGWKDEDGNTVAGIFPGQTGNITLTADWIGKEFKYNEINTAINAPITIIAFEQASGSVNRTYYIGDSTNEITLRGSGNTLQDISFVVMTRGNNLTIRLYDFNFTASNFNDGINGTSGNYLLNIESCGTSNTIIGGINNSSNDATCGIRAGNIVVEGSASLEIKGGIGATGIEAGDGRMGGIGIKSENIDIRINTLSVYGGNGGKGGVGCKGVNGNKGSDGNANLNLDISSGKTGSDGLLGGQGGAGGNGNFAIIATQVLISSDSYVTLYGGSGGEGGNGGNGGQGGEGGNGAKYTAFTTAGDGGDGGDGGNGGQGGTGGNKCSATNIALITGNYVSHIGESGQGGSGGEGGIAGNGGSGGETRGGAHRPDGEAGNNGSSGETGENGN